MNKSSTNPSTIKKARNLFFAVLSMILLTNSVKSQVLSCAAENYLQEQLAADPGLKSRMDAIKLNQAQIADQSSFARATSSAIIIPVVVHVVYNTAGQNISDAQIQSQIDVLNEDYSRSNTDTINEPGAFKPFAGNPNVQFVLAKRDPTGSVTNGITRTATALTYFTTNNYVKFTAYGGIDAWNTTQYLNSWVCNLSGYGGYSAMPGETASIDGVVINYLCFGRIGALMSTRNKGRASTHEVGHWLGLAHLWGWSGTCGDDAIADTPTQEKSNSGIPVFPHVSSCSPNSNGDMFMDYMDYTDDIAQNMFTINQSTEMNGILHGYRSSLLTSLGGVAPGSSAVCNTPGGLSTSSVSANAAILQWIVTGATSYSVRYKPTASTTWNTLNALTNSVSLSGLTGSTIYEFQVASVCSGGVVSAFSSSATFTTAFTTSVTPTTTLTIGNSNSIMPDAPYGTAFAKEHAQFIISRSDLVAAGYDATHNLINSLSFFVNTASAQSLNGFTIKIEHTASSSFASSNFLSTANATTVYASNFITSAAAWNKHSFTSPFVYNGSDNLLIDIVWSNSSGSTSSTVKCTAGLSNTSLYYGANTKKTNLSSVTSGTLSLNRPNMILEFSAPAGARIAADETIAASVNGNVEMELYPNPVSAVMNIALNRLPEATEVQILIYNISGALVAKYAPVSEGGSRQIVTLDFNSGYQLQSLADGIYICQMHIQGKLITKKFILGRS